MSASSPHKLLMLSRSFPPFQAAGSHRVIRLGKYLPEFNWDCVVGTTLETCWPSMDPSLLNQVPPEMKVYRFPCRDPRTHLNTWLNQLRGPLAFPRKLIGKAVYYSLWNLSSPDSAIWRMGSIYRDVAKIVAAEQPDAIWITGTPFSWFTMIHHLKRQFGLPVILDLRDPWTQSPRVYRRLRRLRRPIDRWHERRALVKADAVVFNTPRTLAWYTSRYPKADHSKWHYLTNGYVREEIGRVTPEVFDRITVVHGGHTDLERNSCSFIAALGRLRQAGVVSPETFRYVSYGSGIPAEHAAARDAGVADMVEFRGKGAHHDVLAALKGASALFVMAGPLQTHNIPCKIYEYFVAARPIIAAGPLESDMADLLTAARTGPVMDYNDVDRLASAIEDLMAGRLIYAPDETVIASKDARALAGELATILDSTLKR
jgi:glycosyltransferase involved in cell wall biosynthesis